MKIKDWIEEAACSGLGSKFFFVRKHKDQAKAKAVCRECPIINECLKWAVDNDESGIWGGTTKAEREALK